MTATKKMWLGFGGVKISLFNANNARIGTAEFDTASGSIRFSPVYRYKATDIDFNIKEKLKGFRVILNCDHLLNAAPDEYIEFRKLINLINLKTTQAGETLTWGVIPRFDTGSNPLNFEFKDMIFDNEIAIMDGEKFRCYQETSMSFQSRQLISAIPNLYESDVNTTIPERKVTKLTEFIPFGNYITKENE